MVTVVSTEDPHPVRQLVLGALAAALLHAAPGAAQGIGAPPGPVHDEAPTEGPVPASEASRWRADMDQLARELEERHADLFHTLAPEAFAERVAALRERIPTLARHEIIVGLMGLVAAVGDGHTSVPVLFDPAAGFHVLPLRLGLYEERLFVEAADSAHRAAVGARVTAIGGVPTPEALARVSPLVSRDNEIWIRAVAPRYLAVTEILHAVGLSGDPMAAELTLEREGGGRTLAVRARPEPFRLTHGPGMGRGGPPGEMVDARDASEGPPALRWRHPGRPYWSEYLPEHRTLYIRYDQVNDAPRGPGVHAFFDGALAVVDRRPVDRLILDIRDNSGGEGSLNIGVVKRILRRPELDRPGRLFVIIGRRTFSAAQALAHLLEDWTEAIFLGEPTGSSPRFYGDHSFFRLSNSGLLVSAAPTWWQPGGPYDDRPYLAPRLAFEPRFEDYLADRDPAVEAALRWDERVTLEERVLAALFPGEAGEAGAGAEGEEMRAEAGAEGAAAAAAATVVREWSADPVNRYARATAELNRLGYRLLREGRTEEALAVFRLNVGVHPTYANGWDSLGEALLAAGRREEGLDAYRRAFELDPDVGRAAEVLGREEHPPPPESMPPPP